MSESLEQPSPLETVPSIARGDVDSGIVFAYEAGLRDGKAELDEIRASARLGVRMRGELARTRGQLRNAEMLTRQRDALKAAVVRVHNRTVDALAPVLRLGEQAVAERDAAISDMNAANREAQKEWDADKAEMQGLRAEIDVLKKQVTSCQAAIIERDNQVAHFVAAAAMGVDAQHAVEAERDRARDTAVRLEDELFDCKRLLAELDGVREQWQASRAMYEWVLAELTQLRERNDALNVPNHKLIDESQWLREALERIAIGDGPAPAWQLAVNALRGGGE